MEEFIRGTTAPFCDIFTYRRSRLETRDGSDFRIGPRLIDSFLSMKSMNDLKPGRIAPEVTAQPKSKNNPNMSLVIYMWTLSEDFSVREIDLEFIRSMLDGGASMLSSDKFGQTILHALVRDWHPDTLRFAEEQNTDLNAQDNFGVTPLHLAAGMNLRETTEELLKHGGIYFEYF